jgi:hypothetical protein
MNRSEHSWKTFASEGQIRGEEVLTCHLHSMYIQICQRCSRSRTDHIICHVSDHEFVLSSTAEIPC